MSAVDRAIVGAAGATVVGLAGVAFPVSVDGIEVVASLVLLAHRRAATRAGWLPWADR